jgi:diguanylate cyclase
MRLAFKKKQTDACEQAELTAALYECHQKQEFLRKSVQTLLQFIKEFAFDLKELGSDRFKRDIGVLGEKFDAGKKLRKTQACFHKQEKHIRKFVDRQKNYLAEREKELKDIIDLLAKAMVAVDTDNQQYNQKIYKQSEKIEQITRLDDIKKIKQSLKQELENIKQTVRDKQTRDSKKLKILSKKVSTLNHELKRAKVDSVTDGLTGIYNRKAFDRHIQELISQNASAHTSFALLMVDIDNFKDVNDSYGHQTGDRVLLALADKCSNNIRSGDFVARYGGDEFIVVLANASLRDAGQKAKKLRKAISGTRYSLEDVKTGHTLSITVSIGVSIYRKGDSLKTITDRADQALYVAKRVGKNRVASEDEINSDQL